MADDNQRKADEQRKASLADAKKTSEENRKSAEETLAEQAGMKPVPSQEEADAIKLGVADPLEREDDEQPDGPAARAVAGAPDVLTRQLNAATGGEYKTRSAQPAQQKPAAQHDKPQQHPKP